ncbi:MAG: thermopsin family protease, partial [Acidilobus sp.]
MRALAVALLVAFLSLAAAARAIAASPVGPTYYGVEEQALTQGDVSLLFGQQPPAPVNLTAVLGWIYIRQGSFTSQGYNNSISVQLNVDVVAGNSTPSYLWAQAVAGLRELGNGTYEVRFWANVWNLTGPLGLQEGVGSPVRDYSVVYGNVITSYSAQGPFLFAGTGWQGLQLPVNLTLAVAAQGGYLGIYYGLGPYLRPLAIIRLPYPTGIVVWPREGMDAEFVVGGLASGSEAYVRSWSAEASLRYYA